MFYHFNSVVLQIGACVSYVIFFIKFFEIALDLENTYSNKLLFLILSLIVIGPMSMISDYSLFFKWSYFGNICALTCILFVTFYDLDRLRSVEYEAKVADFTEFASFYGICIFSFEVGGIFRY